MTPPFLSKIAARRVLCAMIVLVALLPAWSQTEKSTRENRESSAKSGRRAPNPVPPGPELRGPIEKFFLGIKAGESRKAYEDLVANTNLAEREELKILINKTDQALALYGKATTFEVYDNYSVGANLIVLTYLTHHQFQPLRWRLVYYRAEKTWSLIDVRVDDQLEDLIDY
jgi:hypothetical protein